MVDYRGIPLGKELVDELCKLSVDFAFQPIYTRKERELVAYEALMRPQDMRPMQLIESYKEMGKLYVIEVATLFGALQEYLRRGFQEMLCINTFPTEYLGQEETEIFCKTFDSSVRNKVIYEMLEYPRFDEHAWRNKTIQVRGQGQKLALDDFGTGYSNSQMLRIVRPDIVKLDRVQYIKDIHKSKAKQAMFLEVLDSLHERGLEVLAEGIECKEEMDFIETTDVDYIQGFYLGIPS